MAYTPGPWKVAHNRIIEIKPDTPDWQDMIAHVYHSGRVNGNTYISNAEDNARLIAAAPELLEALELAIDNWVVEDAEDATDLNFVRSIVAKAKGEE